mgnify:FL=1
MGKCGKTGKGGQEAAGGTKELFTLSRDVRKRLRECCKEGENGQRHVMYLWVCVCPRGIGETPAGGDDSRRLSLQDWLNILDEAASLGACWVVLSMTTQLSRHEDLWDICRWAQEAHGMMVGIHLVEDDVTPEETARLKQLDGDRLRLLVRRESLGKLKPLEDQGLVLWTANPQEEDGARPRCQGPSRMIYVNAAGELFTCGLVDGLDQYRMGNALRERLRDVMRDPCVPHSVDESLHRISSGCDGCPSLIANFFDANL